MQKFSKDFNHMTVSANLKSTFKGAYTRLVKRGIGPYRFRYHWLKKTQWYDPQTLEQIQLDLLQKMVRHACQTVPYYRKLMDNLKIKPSDIQSLGDIKQFPIITKADLKTAGDAFVSRKYPTWMLRTVHTGGTTGLPVPIRRDFWSIGNEHAFVRRQFDWAGVGIHDRCAYLEGRIVRPMDQTDGPLFVYDAAMKELSLSTFHLCPETVPLYLDAMKAYHIDAMIAYPSAAYVMAREILEKGREVSLKCLMTTSETLEEGKKKIIEQAFGCRVVDFYGSAERVCYIHMCEKGTYHIVPEYGFTELIPAAAPNEGFYTIVSTGFWNKTMPLIRYNMNDLVLPGDGPCPCGRHFPTIKQIVGRDSNIIRTPSGRQLGASAIECILAHVLYGLYDMPVLAGQVIQEKSDELMLEYVPTSGFNDEHKQLLQKLLREKVPSELKTAIRRVDEMTRSPRGKFLNFVMNEHH